jgi:hypothetical protein
VPQGSASRYNDRDKSHRRLLAGFQGLLVPRDDLPIGSDWETNAMSSARILPLALVLAAITLSGAKAQGAPPQDQKAGQPAVCGALKNFVLAEEKVVKFVSANGVWCGVPPEAVKQMKANHSKSIKLRDQVCNNARPAAAAAAAPSLSDALGTSRIPDASTTRTGRGTLDTLTGNPLAR